MQFSVNSNALTGLSDMMDRRWEDFESARVYVKSDAQFSAVNAGVLNDVWGEHQKIVDGIDAFLSSAAQGFAGPCATAVTEANLTYRHSDLSTAARVDAALRDAWADPRFPAEPPAVAAPVGLADQSLDRSVFADPTCPTTWLQPPPDHRADYPYEFTFFDTLSPSQYLRQEVWRITSVAAHLGLIPRPVDIFMEIVQPLSGDWARFLGCADVFDNVAQVIKDAAACVEEGQLTIGRVWTGNAGDACARALGSFGANLRAAVDPLHGTASVYRSVAEVVREEAKLLAALLSTLLDIIIEDAFEAPTAGLEAPLEIATELADLNKVLHLTEEIIATVNKVRADAAARMASTGGLLAELGVVKDLHPVPAMTAAAPSLPMHGSVRAE